MTKIIFSGPEGLHSSQYPFIQRYVTNLWEHNPTEFISGCAHGVDTSAAFAAEGAFPGRVHRLVVPEGKHNQGLVQRWELWSRSTPDTHVIEYCQTPRGKNPHIYRDEVMVNHGEPGQDILVAFPHTLSEYARSGTWVTVRRARERGLRIYLVPLREGDPVWE